MSWAFKPTRHSRRLLALSPVDPLNLESQNQNKPIPVGLPSSPIKFWGKLV